MHKALEDDVFLSFFHEQTSTRESESRVANTSLREDEGLAREKTAREREPVLSGADESR